MQLAVTFSKGKITAVKALQTPSGDGRSQQIASYAVPQLTSETLSAQNAQIDAVSGATYTSEGYVQSLQSALDKAGV
ncbi:FMN-binding protein [Streptomyces sp. NPDC000941]